MPAFPTTDVTPETVVRVSPQALVREVADESVILHIETGEYFKLDAAGTRVWHLIEERGRLADVVAVIVQEYDVLPDDAQRDLEHLVTALAARGLVSLSEAHA